jgi:hypothetical protein
MSIDQQVLEQTDFSGGITDNDIGSTSNKFSECDNLLITPSRQLEGRPGSKLDTNDPTKALIPSLSYYRIGALINYDSDDSLVVFAGKNFYSRDVSGNYQTATTPTDNHAFKDALATTVISFSQWNRHILVCSNSNNKPVKIFKHQGQWRCLTAGLPGLSSTPTITGTAGANNYIYAFAYKRTYHIDDVTYEDWGPTTVVIKENIADPSVNAVQITNIPFIPENDTNNYDNANIKLVIFRTINGGTTLFEIGEKSYNQTNFSDNKTDSQILNNPVIYTTGDVFDNDPPPANATICHITNGIAYYAVDNKVYQSVPGDFDSVPASSYRQFDEKITGINSVNGIPIIFGKSKVWRVDGIIDEIGSGDIAVIKISDSAGCVSNNSIVQINAGLVWFGVDGIYTTDGYRVLRINDDLQERYSAMIETTRQKEVIHGAYDKVGNRVYWSVQKESTSSTDCDSCLVLDLRWGLSSTSSFTTLSGGNSFSPTAITFFNNDFYRGDRNGFVLIHKDNLLNDPTIDLTIPVANWTTQAIPWTFRSIHHNFGTSATKKFVSRILVTCKNLTNISLGLRSINDQNLESKILIPINFKGNMIWGFDVSSIWGDNRLIWDFDGIIEEKRRFPAFNLRLNYKQIELTNAEVTISNSDAGGKASLIGNAIHLNNPNSMWPLDCVGMQIYFNDDNYQKAFTITSRTDDTILTNKQSDLLPGTNKEWIIKGIPRNERLHLVSYVMQYGLISPTHKAFDGYTGANK